MNMRRTSSVIQILRREDFNDKKHEHGGLLTPFPDKRRAENNKKREMREGGTNLSLEKVSLAKVEQRPQHLLPSALGQLKGRVSSSGGGDRSGTTENETFADTGSSTCLPRRGQYGSIPTSKSTVQLLEAELTGLGERTKKALEESYDEMQILGKEKAEKAEQVQKLELELAALKERMKSRQQKQRQGGGSFCGIIGSNAMRRRRSKHMSAPDLRDFIRKSFSGTTTSTTSASSSMPSADASRKGNSNNESFEMINLSAAPAKKLSSFDRMRRTQSCLSAIMEPVSVSVVTSANDAMKNTTWTTMPTAPPLLALPSTSFLQKQPSPQAPRHHGSIAEVLGRMSILGMRDHLRDERVANLHHRLVAADQFKIQALTSLASKLHGKELERDAVLRTIGCLCHDLESLRMEMSQFRREHDKYDQNGRSHRMELMRREAIILRENIRGKDRELRYMAVGVGRRMAELAMADDHDDHDNCAKDNSSSNDWDDGVCKEEEENLTAIKMPGDITVETK